MRLDLQAKSVIEQRMIVMTGDEEKIMHFTPYVKTHITNATNIHNIFSFLEGRDCVSDEDSIVYAVIQIFFDHEELLLGNGDLEEEATCKYKVMFLMAIQ